MVEIPEAPNYGAIRKATEFEALVDKLLKEGKPFGFDIETGFTGNPKEPNVALKPFHPDWLMVGFSFTNSLKWARYVPMAHDTGVNVDDRVRTLRALWRLLQSGLGVAHNASFELKCLALEFRMRLWNDEEVGEEVRAANGYFPIRACTMIECFLYQEYDPMAVGQGLKGLVKHLYGHKMTEFDALFADLIKNKVIKATQKAFNILPPEGINVEYACEDALYCLALHLDHFEKVSGNIVYKTEMALLQVCAEMEEEGLLINWDAMESKDQEVLRVRDIMNEEIQDALSERLGRTVTVNLNSPKQVAEVLYSEAPKGLGLPVLKRNKKSGAPMTDEKTLRGLAAQEPIIRRILTYREVAKLHGSYLHKYHSQEHYADNGRAYPNHKQTGAATGRFSVDGMPYQQWPKPYHYELKDGTVFDLNFRDLLLAPQGFRIVGFDYSQVEMRVLAGVAQEKALLQAFADGIDLHVMTASRMLGVPIEEVNEKQRSMGKTLNFAIVYGSTAKGIAEQLVCSVAEAEEKLEQYFAAFPGIKKWVDSQVLAGRAQGFVQNLFGRKVTVWDYKSRLQYIRNNGDRFCGNAPIQGGAADYFKIAMVRANRAIKKAGLQDKIRMVITFHDALEFYVHESIDTQTVIDVLGPAVSYAVKGLPDIKADWHEGYQWGSLAEIDLDADGKVAGYSRKVLLADKSKKKWEADNLDDCLTPFYYWAANHFGSTYHDLDFFLSHVPAAREFEAEFEEPAPVAEVPSQDEKFAENVTFKATIELPAMPKRSQWVEFMGFLKKNPGDVVVEVVTPKGPITLDTTHAIDKDNAPLISLMFDGARVDIRKDIEVEDLMAELELV